jgi:hypothetical protein
MTKKKHVVIVSPQFPPSNLTAGHRSRYFATHLGKFDWKVTVLSVDPLYYEEKLDHELERLLPPGLEIIRTKAFPTKPVRIIGDVGIRAFWWHYLMLCRLAKTHRPDLIYIPIPPNFSSLLGAFLYKRFKIPYAIDYIDPWVHAWPGCEKVFSKAWLSYRLGQIFERIALKDVSLITAVAPRYYEGALQRYPWLDASRCLAMPYGAEESDFQYLNEHPRDPYLFDPHDGYAHFCYAGAMLPKAYSTLEALFQGVHVLREKDPHIGNRLRLHFIGTGSDLNDPCSFTVLSRAKAYDLADAVIEHPARIPFLDALNHLKHAHAVLILGSSESHYSPSKIFQAVLSRRPVIALLHAKSTAVGILKESNAGAVVTFDEKERVRMRVDGIAEALYDVMTNRYSPEQIDWERFRKYSSERMAGELARAFDAVTERKKP